MADNKQDGIAVFDTIFTNNHICMLKNILPFLPTAFQRFIAIYIKYLELQYTMQYFDAHPQGLCTGRNNTEKQPFDAETMWDSILPYCSPSEKQKFQQIRDMMQNFQQMKEMMEMMETMKELFPDGFSGMEDAGFPSGFGGMDGSNFSAGLGTSESANLNPPTGMDGLFRGNLNPEIINMLSSLFNSNTKKGNQQNE